LVEILTSNLSFSQWNEIFGDPVIATAILSRLNEKHLWQVVEGERRRRLDSELLQWEKQSEFSVLRNDEPSVQQGLRPFLIIDIDLNREYTFLMKGGADSELNGRDRRVARKSKFFPCIFMYHK